MQFRGDSLRLPKLSYHLVISKITQLYLETELFQQNVFVSMFLLTINTYFVLLALSCFPYFY